MTHEEQLTLLRLQKENIELKGIVLGSQLKAIESQITTLLTAATQAEFDAAIDARDMPSGATKPPDQYSGD